MQDEITVESYVINDYRRIEVTPEELDPIDFTTHDYVVVRNKDVTVVINCRNVEHVVSSNGKIEVKLPGETITISEEGILITP